MVATILWRMAGPGPMDDFVGFEDVLPGRWYSEAVAWAFANGIVQGADPGTFAPDAPITREQIAVMLYRYALAAGLDVAVPAGFTLSSPDDGQVSDWALEGMRWAVHSGLVRGVDQGRLNPLGAATRAEGTVLLQRFVSLLES